jgi:hypothetical protein
MKKIIIWSGIVLTLAIFMVFAVKQYHAKNRKQPAGKSEITYTIIPGKYPGWGFKIFVNGKLFIIQDRIPVVQGNISFKEKIHAERVARMMIKKMAKETFPQISIQELKDAGAIE